MDKSKKPANDIRVSFNSKIGGIVSYCEKLLKENNMRDLNFSAVGGSIGTLVSVVELLKTIHPGLYQINRFATISYQSVEEGGKSEAENHRLFPKLEVKLTLDKPAKPTEGFQDKLDEEERKKLLDLHNKRREEGEIDREEALEEEEEDSEEEEDLGEDEEDSEEDEEALEEEDHQWEDLEEDHLWEEDHPWEEEEDQEELEETLLEEEEVNKLKWKCCWIIWK